MKTCFFFLVLFSLLACHQEHPAVSHLVVRMFGTSVDSVVIRRISQNNDPSRIILSGVLHYSRDSMVFDLPRSPDSLYQLSLKFSENSLFCIPDQPEIRIFMNKRTGKNTITGSPVSSALLSFMEQQDSLNHLAQKIRLKLKDFPNDRIGLHEQDSLRQVSDNIGKFIQQRYSDFADTVSNAASFMVNFDYINFQDDFGRMKNLIKKAADRFPNSVAIGRLKEQVMKLAHIHEMELQVGDLFPELQLPDLDGHMYSTAEVKGNYIFYDFWSSWCRNCLAYQRVKPGLIGNSRFKNLVLISVAMDNKLEACREIVKINHQPGIQLIDKDMWQGQTAARLAFDSIPFNYLVGPDQLILARAIPADSVILVLKKFIH